MSTISALFKGITRSKLISVLGFIFVVVSMIDPALYEGHPRVRALAVTVGALAALLGRALLHQPADPFNTQTFRSLVFLIVPLFVLTVFTTGCPSNSQSSVNSDPQVKAIKRLRTACAITNEVAGSLGDATDIVRQLRDAGEVEPSFAHDFALGALDANSIMREGVELALSYQTIDESARVNIASHLEHARTGISNLLNDGTLHIKNPRKSLYWNVGLIAANSALRRLQDTYDTSLPAGFTIPIDSEARKNLERAHDTLALNEAKLRADISHLN